MPRIVLFIFFCSLSGCLFSDSSEVEPSIKSKIDVSGDAGNPNDTSEPACHVGCVSGEETTTCNEDCTASICGDGILNTTSDEECDAAGETAVCNVDCTTSLCGDEIRNENAGEECDAGGETAVCNVDCTTSMCGDGVVNITAGEECDAAGETAVCNVDCTTSMCGDGVVNITAGEECDDAGAGVKCNFDCSSKCRDGVIDNDADEECDDGNTTDDDKCNNLCSLNFCGDGIKNNGELCDDGNNDNADRCSNDCRNYKTVFVSHDVFTADFEGLGGADAKCQEFAGNERLLGTFKAWLSDGSTDPGSRFTKSKMRYQLTDGVVVASGWEGLISGPLSNPIIKTEKNFDVTPFKRAVWTNTSTDGTKQNVHCNNWSSKADGDNGGLGFATAKDSEWTSKNTISCSQKARIYCFEQ